MSGFAYGLSLVFGAAVLLIFDYICWDMSGKLKSATDPISVRRRERLRKVSCVLTALAILLVLAGILTIIVFQIV